MVFSVGIFVASQMGAMPVGIGTTVVLIGMGIVLKLAWSISSKAASSPQNARFALVMSNVGLTIAALVGLLFAAAGPARTLRWRSLLGAFLLGFPTRRGSSAARATLA
jgi:hypothetical protein